MTKTTLGLLAGMILTSTLAPLSGCAELPVAPSRYTQQRYYESSQDQLDDIKDQLEELKWDQEDLKWDQMDAQWDQMDALDRLKAEQQ